jgi:hypothetical protein
MSDFLAPQPFDVAASCGREADVFRRRRLAFAAQKRAEFDPPLPLPVFVHRHRL